MDKGFFRGMSSKLRILLGGAMALSLSFSREPRAVLLLMVYATLIALLGNISLKKALRNLLRVEGLLLCLWCTLPFSGGGETFLLGPLSLSLQGIRLAFLISLKGAAMVLTLTGLFADIPIHHIFQAFRELHLPLKLVGLFHFSFRYIQVLEEEKERLFQAALLRGFEPAFSHHSMKTLFFLGANLLIKSYDRSKRVQEALILRGFNGNFPCFEAPQKISRSTMLRFSVLLLGCGGCILS